MYFVNEGLSVIVWSQDLWFNVKISIFARTGIIFLSIYSHDPKNMGCFNPIDIIICHLFVLSGIVKQGDIFVCANCSTKLVKIQI